MGASLSTAAAGAPLPPLLLLLSPPPLPMPLAPAAGVGAPEGAEALVKGGSVGALGGDTNPIKLAGLKM
jgi:hypothetical protein